MQKCSNSTPSLARFHIHAWVVDTLHAKWEDIAHPSFLHDSRCSTATEILWDCHWSSMRWQHTSSLSIWRPFWSPECSPVPHRRTFIRAECESRRSWLKTNECRNWSIKVARLSDIYELPLDRSMSQSPFHYSHYIVLEERHKAQRQA